jgi:hypothetical protein
MRALASGSQVHGLAKAFMKPALLSVASLQNVAKSRVVKSANEESLFLGRLVVEHNIEK